MAGDRLLVVQGGVLVVAVLWLRPAAFAPQICMTPSSELCCDPELYPTAGRTQVHSYTVKL